MTRAWKISFAAVLTVLAVATYGFGAWHSPLFDAEAAARAAYLRQMSRASGYNLETERARALKYWRDYPDVAADPYFGENGQLGIFGAREHYRRHGRREGRTWPR